MEETMFFFKHCSILTILVINLFSLNGATSEVYKVGDEEEWNAEVNFVAWSQKYNFGVGDVLNFKYEKGQHNAYEVTEATYRSCNASTGVLAEYESGDDEVKLNQSKKYWFICNVPGHCLGGMRFSIDVKEAIVTSVSNSTRGSTPEIEPSPSANSSNKSYALKRWRMGIHLFLFGILIKLYF